MQGDLLILLSDIDGLYDCNPMSDKDAKLIDKVSALQDPIGEALSMWKTPDNLTIAQVRVPLGVIGIIYEARPNVIVDAAGLCIKAGNTVILREGVEDGLIKAVVENATVPVIETGVGNCHVYVDESADFEMAKNIIINAKTQRPAVCNAMEILLVHSLQQRCM